MARIFADIRFAKGLQADLPTLEEGKPAITRDEKRVFVGSDSGNVELAKQDGVNGLAQRVSEHDEDIISITKKTDSWADVQVLGSKGDGANDDTTFIQQALSLAKVIVTGIKVKIPKGTYKLTSTLRCYQNTVIEMEPGTTLLRCHNGSILINGDSGASYIGYEGQGNIFVSGGTLDGNIINYPDDFNIVGLARGKSIVFNNVTFKDVVNGHGLDINACNTVLIDNCRFIGYKVNSSDSNSSVREAVQIADHTLLGFTDFGVYDATPSKNIMVRNCYFGASGTAGTIAFPTGVGHHSATHDIYSSSIKVIDNKFEGMSLAGVRVFKYKDVLIQGNEFVSCYNGVHISSVAPNTESSKTADGTQSGLPQAGSNYIIANNIFKGCTNEAIYGFGQMDTGIANPARIERVIISDNVIDGDTLTSFTGTGGIRLSLVKNVLIANNTFKKMDEAIYVSYPLRVVISDNIAEDLNEEFLFTNEPDATYQGKNFSSKVTVSNNHVYNCGRTGIYLQFIDGFNVSGNYLEAPATETDNTRNGITIANSSKNGRAFNNKVKMATTGNQNMYGLSVSASCSNVQTFNNDVEGKTGRFQNLSTGGFEGYYIHSADGTRYKVTVANGGTVAVTAG